MDQLHTHLFHLEEDLEVCPRKEYARLEILAFMHNVVKRFNWEKLISNEKIILDPMPMPAKGLPVRLIPHKHVD
ncbi:hypothetical protein Pint_32432 [Pistacia integerrima]|uniref:Uncharacterized protein n=1 Tax=Pistacia integerrima TaxID=434235 RepID=A0ACC0XMC9_9ROSI|nr:hypothetical protein Pint_32432 [Pistacia integerrima]